MSNVTVIVTIPQKHRLTLGDFLSKEREHQLCQAGRVLTLLSPTAKTVNISLPVYVRDCAITALETSDDAGFRRLAKLFKKEP
jgi:hypothetical protein